MATYDVPARSDRWQLAGAGPLTVDASTASLLLVAAAAKPSDDETVANALVIGGSGSDTDNRYTYEGDDNIYLRLASPVTGEPTLITVLKEGATSAAVAPFLPNMALETDADTTLTVAAPGLLTALEAAGACTITAASDAAGAFTIGSPKNLAVGGALTINADGSYVFNPDGDFDALKGDATSAVDEITLTITDANTLTTTARLDVTVTGVNDGPAAVNDTAAATQGAIITGNVLTDGTDDSHPQSEPIWLTKINGVRFNGGLPITLPSGSIFTPKGDGSYTYEALADTGDDVINYTIADRWGVEDSGTLTVTVSAP